jgi:hypothetical protein
MGLRFSMSGEFVCPLMRAALQWCWCAIALLVYWFDRPAQGSLPSRKGPKNGIVSLTFGAKPLVLAVISGKRSGLCGLTRVGLPITNLPESRVVCEVVSTSPSDRRQANPRVLRFGLGRNLRGDEHLVASTVVASHLVLVLVLSCLGGTSRHSAREARCAHGKTSLRKDQRGK